MSFTTTNKTSKYLLLFYSIGIVLALYFVLNAGFWAWEQRRYTEIRLLIPSNAIAAFQSASIGFAKEDLASTGAGQQLLGLPYFKGVYRQLQELDSMAGKYPPLNAVLYEQQVWYSLHRLSKYELGFIGYVPIGANRLKHAWTQKLLLEIAIKYNWELRTREYKGFDIVEIGPSGQPAQWVGTYYKNYYIGSPHALLVEESIRQILGQLPGSLEGMPPFREQMDTTTLFNCYINGNEWLSLWGVISEETNNIRGLGWYWKVSVDNHLMKLKGQSFWPYQQAQWGDLLDNATASPSGLLSVIPFQTAFVLKGGVRDGRVVENILRKIFHEEAIINIDNDLLEAAQKEWAYLSGDILLLQADSSAVYEYAEGLENDGSGIFQVEEEHQLRLGNSESKRLKYLAYEGGYCALGVDYASLQQWKQAVRQERTWLVEEAFLPLKEEQQWAFCWNTEQAWPLVLNQLSKPWKSLLQAQQLELLQLEAGGAYVNGGKEVEVVLDFHQALLADKQEQSLVGQKDESTPRYLTVMPAAARTAPQVLPQLTLEKQAHVNGIIFQDRWNNVRLLGERGQRLWSVGVGRPLTQAPKAIDYYRNGRWQYFFYANNGLFIVDRLGRAINKFPMYFPYKIAHAQIIDRGEGADYLFLLDDPQGNAYMYLQRGEPVSFWQPLRYSGGLVQAPQAVPMGQNWLVGALQADLLNLHDLQGNPIKGFPITFPELLLKDFEITSGYQLSEVVIRILVSKGQVIKVDGLGNIIDKQQLPAQALDDRFEILRNEGGDEGWLWARVSAATQSESANVALFSIEGKRLLRVPISCPEDAQVQYFDFGNQRRFLAVTCLKEEQTQLYLFNGQALGGPIASSLPIDIMYDDARKALRVYRHLAKESSCLLIDTKGVIKEW